MPGVPGAVGKTDESSCSSSSALGDDALAHVK